MRDLVFIQACPNDNYYSWQTHLWLESLKKIGKSDKAISLIFNPKGRTPDLTNWHRLENLYPEAKFVYYNDDHDISQYLTIYISIPRPYVLWRYFKDHPEMVGKAVFYCDCDILFTEHFNIDKYIDDDICYLSDTNSYINASYFDSKIKDVLPEKLEEYKTRDILGEVTSFIGIDRQICENNNDHSGGAQYLLKNIDSSFWSKMITDTIIIRTYLQKVNREYFLNEDKGFQSFCSDMWALLWNLWLREYKTLVVPEMGFSWAPDPVSKLETHPIYHNAGIASEMMLGYPTFYKGKYHMGANPFTDPFLDIVLNNEESKRHCTWYYVNAMKELYEKYKLDY